MEPRRNGKYEQANNKYWNGNYGLKTPDIDGGGIGWEDHFLPHKFIQRTFEHWVNSIKQLLNAGRGHQASRTVSHCLQKEVGKNRKDKKGDKRGRDGDPSQEGSLKKERSMQIPGNTLTGKSVASLGTSEGNISSAQSFSRSVVSDSLQPHELQHARPPCPSPTPGVYPNPCPSSQWCHPAI